MVSAAQVELSPSADDDMSVDSRTDFEAERHLQDRTAAAKEYKT